MDALDSRVPKPVVDFNAYDWWSASERHRNFKRATLQHCRRRTLEFVYREWIGSVRDQVLQGVPDEWRRKDHLLVFATRGRRVGNVVFVVGVAVRPANGGDVVAVERHIRPYMAHQC